MRAKPLSLSSILVDPMWPSAIRLFDIEGVVTWANPAFYKLTGLKHGEVLGKKCNATFPCSDCGKRECPLQKIHNGESTVTNLVMKGKPDGTFIWCQITTLPYRDDANNLIGVIQDIRDITNAVTSDIALYETRRILETTIQGAPVAMVGLDSDARVLMWNSAAEDLLGWRSDEVIGKPYPCIPEEAATDFATELKRLRKGESLRNIEVRRKRKDGSMVDISLSTCPLIDKSGLPYGTFAILSDITERKRHETRLEYLATHDTVTNLPNRRAFNINLARIVRDARKGNRGWLILVDLDNFKMINDSVGHPAGDELLVAVTNLIKTNLAGNAFLARVGGDEFAIILRDKNPMAGILLAEKVRRTVEQHHFPINENIFTLTVSIGLTAIDGTLQAHEAFSLADSAMYAAKEEGRNRTVELGVGDQERRIAYTEATSWLVRIKDALQDNHFELHYQPIMTTSNEAVLCYEALLRLRDTDGQLFTATDFLPTAEQFGLMPQIDRWVLEATIRSLLDDPQLKVFVNLSGQSLQGESLLESLESKLLHCPDIASRITLEITETTAITHLSQLQRWISRLQSLGCRFALDDFGSGFCSFAYLRSLAVDYVKIDRSFIKTLGSDPVDQVFVKAIHAITMSLGKTTIAEGIESEAALLALRNLGVRYAQGFYWGKPQALKNFRLPVKR